MAHPRIGTEAIGMTDERIDWPAIAEPVVSALLGAPNGRLTRGRRWRYGTKGSMSVNLDRGTWYDFEAVEGGGLLALIKRVQRTDNAGAFQWLAEQGHVPRSAPGRGRPGLRPVPTEPTEPEPKDASDLARKIALARAIWASVRPAAGTPVEAYLSARGCWPKAPGDWCPALPDAVGWIDRADLHRVDPALDAGTPPASCGMMVFAYRPALGGELSAVSVEALTADGARCGEDGRWRRTRGQVRGSVAALPGVAAGARIALVEGEADGLAVVLMAHADLYGLGGVGEVRVVVGTSGMMPDKAADDAFRPVLLLPDGPKADGLGSAAGVAGRCAATLRRSGRRVSMRIRDDGDVADDLALLVEERAHRFEDGQIGTDEAELMAWEAILTGGGRQ